MSSSLSPQEQINPLMKRSCSKKVSVGTERPAAPHTKRAAPARCHNRCWSGPFTADAADHHAADIADLRDMRAAAGATEAISHERDTNRFSTRNVSGCKADQARGFGAVFNFGNTNAVIAAQQAADFGIECIAQVLTLGVTQCHVVDETRLLGVMAGAANATIVA